MQSTVYHRVISIFEETGLSKRKFAEELGIVPNSVNQYINGERKPSLDFIIAILKWNENISAEWLLRGEGNMYRTKTSIDVASTSGKLFDTLEEWEQIQGTKLYDKYQQIIGEMRAYKNLLLNKK